MEEKKYSCSKEHSENYDHHKEYCDECSNQVEYLRVQLSLKDKMIELMANTILAYSYRTKTIKQCKKIYLDLAQQALAEMEGK